MTKVRTQAAKKSLLRKVRRQRLNYITVLPSLITLMNGLCGFTAIVLAARAPEQSALGNFTPFALSGYLILVAMIADMLDGRVARMSQNTSSFGGQLDSLCDIISFGAAPAFLALKILEYNLNMYIESEVLYKYLQRFIWLAAATYLSCTAIRLARFNVENEEDESAHMSFIGLPSPAAAGVIASLTIFYQEIVPELADKGSHFYIIMESTIVYTLPFVVIGMGLLMVSRIRYSHVLNEYFKGKKPFTYLLSCLAVLGLIVFVRQFALVTGFCAFALSGFIRWAYQRIRHKRDLTVETSEGATEIAPE